MSNTKSRGVGVSGSTETRYVIVSESTRELGGESEYVRKWVTLNVKMS